MISINCKHCKKFRCMKKEKILGIFSRACCEIDLGVECNLAERFSMPEYRVTTQLPNLPRRMLLII